MSSPISSFTPTLPPPYTITDENSATYQLPYQVKDHVDPHGLTKTVDIPDTDDWISVNDSDKTPTAYFVNGTKSAWITVNDQNQVVVKNDKDTGIQVTDQADYGSDGYSCHVTMDGKTFDAWVSEDRQSIQISPDNGTSSMTPGDFSLRRDDAQGRHMVSSNIFSPDWMSYAPGGHGPGGNADFKIANVTGTDDSVAVSASDKDPTAHFVNGTNQAAISLNPRYYPGSTTENVFSVSRDGKDAHSTEDYQALYGPNTNIKVTDQHDRGSDGFDCKVEMDGKTFSVWISQDKQSIDVNPDNGTNQMTAGDFNLRRNDSYEADNGGRHLKTLSSSIFTP